MEINYLIPALSVVVQLVCVYLYISAYKAEGKKNVLASVVAAVFAIFTALVTPYLDGRKAQVMLNRQAENMQAAVEAGTVALNDSNEKLRLAQQQTRQALDSLRQSQHDVKQLRGIIVNGNMLTTNVMMARSASATTSGVVVHKAVRSPMLINSGKMSTGGGPVMVGSTGNNVSVTTYGEPLASETHKDRVSGFTTGSARVVKGQRVRLTAGGAINVGSFVGPSSPEGKPGGLLSAYSINQNFNHAALLYRIAGEASWSPYGNDCVFEAQRDGNIEFQVNDAEQGNNSGYYLVTTQLYAD